MNPRILLSLACCLLPPISPAAEETLNPAIAALLERSNPSYAKPVDRAMQGIPIGNAILHQAHP